MADPGNGGPVPSVNRGLSDRGGYCPAGVNWMSGDRSQGRYNTGSCQCDFLKIFAVILWRIDKWS